MDYLKFSILTIACIGGFMATSYSYLAKQKGWPIGSYFINGNMSYIVVGGFMCQFGSVIISLFVNPWWSAFIVFGLGFVGYMVLSSILKVYSQIVSGVLVVVSIILIPIYVFGNSSLNQNTNHLFSSIDFSNKATAIINQSEPIDTLDYKSMEKIMGYKNQALAEAKKVDIEMLNQRLDGFGDHFNEEFMKGLEIIIEGYETNDPEKFLQGQILDDKWGVWYSNNIERIKEGK